VAGFCRFFDAMNLMLEAATVGKKELLDGLTPGAGWGRLDEYDFDGDRIRVFGETAVVIGARILHEKSADRKTLVAGSGDAVGSPPAPIRTTRTRFSRRTSVKLGWKQSVPAEKRIRRSQLG
jgi:hypothetical protein